MLSKLVSVMGASNLTKSNYVSLPHASNLRLASMSGALAPDKQTTLAGVCNLTLRVTELPMTSDFPPEKDLQGQLPAFASGAADREP